jgi:hypothetical protein
LPRIINVKEYEQMITDMEAAKGKRIIVDGWRKLGLPEE